MKTAREIEDDMRKERQAAYSKWRDEVAKGNPDADSFFYIHQNIDKKLQKFIDKHFA